MFEIKHHEEIPRYTNRGVYMGNHFRLIRGLFEGIRHWMRQTRQSAPRAPKETLWTLELEKERNATRSTLHGYNLSGSSNRLLSVLVSYQVKQIKQHDMVSDNFLQTPKIRKHQPEDWHHHTRASSKHQTSTKK